MGRILRDTPVVEVMLESALVVKKKIRDDLVVEKVWEKDQEVARKM